MGFWGKDGSISDKAPRWAKLRADMKQAFPTYYSTGTEDAFGRLVGEAIRRLDLLKPSETDPGYLGDDPLGSDYGQVT